MTIITFLLALNAHADIGPKPTMSFEWKSKGDVDLRTIKLLQCEKKDCEDAKPLSEVGPQHFRCEQDSCSAMAYGFSEFGQLMGKTSVGKDVKSNVFRSSGMKSEYVVSAKGNKIKVEAK